MSADSHRGFSSKSNLLYGDVVRCGLCSWKLFRNRWGQYMEHLETSEQSKAILYDNAGMSLADFREELEQILSISLFEFRVGKELGGAGTLLPTLELILAFAAGATTTIITSALSELGKDIYNTLKGKLFKKPFENVSSPRFPEH